MTSIFNRIVIFGRPRSEKEDFVATVRALQTFLQARHLDIHLEKETASYLTKQSLPTVTLSELSDQCDLVIVVGGDGALLHAARAAVQYDIPILGINRGRLGFLTDILPNELETKIADILDGNYKEETRFLLETHTEQQQETNHIGDALNDVVLSPGDIAHMIEFEIYINIELVCSQRADGLIIATPTGSTAYALSGGGPILHPQLDTIVLVPMFPHTLSSRPIVIKGDCEITIVINKNNQTSSRIRCDGQDKVFIPPGGRFHVKKKEKQLRLIHPLDYDYYETLRSKLRWETKG